MKTCGRCKTDKALDNFVAGASYKDGRHPWCRTCRTEYQASYRRKKPRPPNDPERQRASQLMRYYGITPEQFEELLTKQGGHCATCPTVPVEGGRKFHVDHDHSCCLGAKSCGDCVRGILCHGCNTALGFVKDDVETLRAMIQYLDKKV